MNWRTLTTDERMEAVEAAVRVERGPFWTEMRQGLFAGWLIGFAIMMGGLWS